ncbi:MAG: 50S ribosomal protein L4 [Balneolaceae bacterium]
MKLTVYKTDGTKSGSNVELSDEVFGIKPHKSLIYEDVRRYLANKRHGTASTKERGEVRGGGKKAYKQKGTGMARRGSIRSPLLKGGGTVFGPRPRNYTNRMTKKMKQLARRSALSVKAASDSVRVVEDFSFDAPRTKKMSEILAAFKLTDKKVLILTPEADSTLYKSGRNIPGVEIVESNLPTTYQILHADVLLIQQSGIEALERSVKPKSEEEAA